jgi:uncharacterized RDD family membrane protein YckC
MMIASVWLLLCREKNYNIAAEVGGDATMKEWYCGINGETKGPFPEATLREMAAREELTPDTLVWNSAPGNAERGWVKASDTEVASIFGMALPAPVTPGTFPIPQMPPARSGFQFSGTQTQAAGAAQAFVPDAAGFTLASRMGRLGAVLIDAAIPGIAGTVAALIAGYVCGLFMSPIMSSAVAMIFMLLVMLIFLVYNIRLLGASGQTIGKKLVGIKIASFPDGSPAPLSRILLFRYLAFGVVTAIPIIGQIVGLADIACIFRSDKRMLHDMMAGTIVINA